MILKAGNSLLLSKDSEVKRLTLNLALSISWTCDPEQWLNHLGPQLDCL